MSIQRRSFGRSTVQSDSAPPAAPVFPSTPSLSFEGFSEDSGRRWLMLLLASPILILLFEGMFSGTELITPLSQPFLWWMRGMGLVDGAVLWWLIRSGPNYEPRGFVREILLMIIGPVFLAAAFDALAWRVADWAAFGLSKAPFEQVVYPIKSVSHGRKGRRDTITIDPFGTGESSHIPIPYLQYRELLSGSEGQCVTVQQRRAANGAVEIRTDGQYTLNEPLPALVTSC